MTTSLLTKRAEYVILLLPSDKMVFSQLLENYEKNNNLDYNFLNKLISLIGVEILDYSHLNEMFKLFVGRDTTQTEEKEIELYLDKIDVKLGFPNGDYLIEYYDSRFHSKPTKDTRKIDEHKIGKYRIVCVVEYNHDDTIMDIKNKIRSQNAFYRNHNLNLMVNGKEISNDNQYTKKGNLIQIQLFSYDRELTIDKLKDMISKYELYRHQYNNYKYPNYYSDKFYDREKKVFKRSRFDAELDKKKSEVSTKLKKIEQELRKFLER